MSSTNVNLNEINKQILDMVKSGKMSKDLALSILKGLNAKDDIKNNDDIAIIGASLRFPGAKNMKEYWGLLESGESKIGSFPHSRREDMDLFLTGSQKSNGNPYSKGGYLDEIDKFDANFFKISPKEASVMEPCQRLFLETAYEAMEDAGYGGDSLSGSKTGVFAGIDHTPKLKFSYGNYINEPDFLAMTGSWTGILATRVSYLLNLHGPSLVIDTGCSSSAVALHNACKSLRDKECTTALAGGINLLMFPTAENSMLSAVESDNEIIRPFDKEAHGTLWGEGVGAVLLKPLQDAIADGDNIYAVIKGSSVNNNGASTNAITALNAEAHKELILKAWENAKINPETISYIEAHGTGTVVGDSIEVSGINNAFREHTQRKNFCGIGSVKGNIGHLVSCSAMASLFKVILALKNEVIPPVINYRDPNPYINFENSSIYIVDKPMDWKKSGEARRAGISCFSFTGTNCHIVIEEPPYINKTEDIVNKESLVFVLSAKTKQSLKNLLLEYKKYLNENNYYNISDVCFTASVGRGHYERRLAIIIDSLEELKEKINVLIEKGIEDNEVPGIYYGEHRLVTSTKQDKIEGEINEGEKRKLGREINSRIKEIMTSHKECEKLREDICINYIKGADIDWKLVYSEIKAKRVNLPVYVYDKLRYWMDLSHIKAAKEFNAEDMIYGQTNLKENVNAAHQLEERDFSVAGKVIQDMKEFESIKLECVENINENEEDGEEEGLLHVVEDYGRIMLLKVFKSMGILIEGGVSYNKDELIAQLGIIDLYKKLFMALMDVLEKDGFVKVDGDTINVSDLVNNNETILKIEKLEAVRNNVVENYPDVDAYFKLIENCVGNYKQILTGETSAISIMFPNYSMDLVGDVYKGNQGVDYFNQLVAVSTRSYIEGKLRGNNNPQFKLKILEVGAGTGGTSAYIFPEISKFADNIEYCYTDISLGFIDYGKKTYWDEYPFLNFKILNIENMIETQGFNLGEFDIVIAANVIHGTHNLKNTINEVKKLLRPNGLFILSEVTKVQDFTTLTFGLTPGWWAFEDQEYRMKHSPLLDCSGWKQLLINTGFKSVDTFGGLSSDSSQKYDSVLSIIVGESNGIYENNNFLNNGKQILPKRIEYGENKSVEVKLKGRKNEVYTDTEKQVARIWAESLGFDEIDVFNNFFDLGGDSIIAMKIVSIISATTGKTINIEEVLSKPSVAEFASYLDEFKLRESNS